LCLFCVCVFNEFNIIQSDKTLNHTYNSEWEGSNVTVMLYERVWA